MHFFCEKRGECGILSAKMDSRVRGNDGGEAGICRRESDSGGGDSDLHRNGKSWKLGKKNLPFRRTPESLREIPIFIGMRTRRNSAKKRRHSRESGNLFGAINFWNFANFTRKLILEFLRIFL